MTYRKRTILAAAIIISLISVGLVLTANVAWPVRTLFAVPFALILPGYVLMTTIAPDSQPGVPEEFLFSLGLSLIIAIAGGFLLNLTPWGLTAQSWVILLAAMTTTLSAWDLIRFKFNWTDDVRQLSFGLSPRQIVLFSLAFIVVVAAWLVARGGAELFTPPASTQLWILPDPNNPNGVNLGVRSQDAGTTHYRLELIGKDQKLMEWPTIELATGGTWEASFTFPPDLRTEKVDAQLFESVQSSAEPYRTASYFYQAELTSTGAATTQARP